MSDNQKIQCTPQKMNIETNKKILLVIIYPRKKIYNNKNKTKLFI